MPDAKFECQNKYLLYFWRYDITNFPSQGEYHQIRYLPSGDRFNLKKIVFMSRIIFVHPEN